MLSSRMLQSDQAWDNEIISYTSSLFQVILPRIVKKFLIHRHYKQGLTPDATTLLTPDDADGGPAQ